MKFAPVSRRTADVVYGAKVTSVNVSGIHS